MLTKNADLKKERPLVKFFQYTGIFSVSRGSPRATNKLDYLYSATFLLASYFLKFSVFIACLMTKAVNFFTLLTSN